MLIKQNGKYGAMVGNIRVFTMEASVVLSSAGDDMHRLGFTWAEIEDMELEAIA